MKRITFFLYLCLIGWPAFAQTNFTHRDSVQSYFDEIKLAAKRESFLWNMDLYGPVLLVDPTTREVYANYADSAGVLKKQGQIYYGNLPAEINIANTSVAWSGRSWAMVMLPLPGEKHDRINLLAHELFHRAQPLLGFRLFNTDNNHLDRKEGRIYLRMELEALIKAVNASTEASARAYLKDAFIFRKYRYAIYPVAGTTENNLELNEGLAEYTGLITSGRGKEKTLRHFNKSLSEFLSNPTFVRSFAYQTTPLYGYLLQLKQKHWNKNVTVHTNLTDYFIKAFNIKLTDVEGTAVRGASLSEYDGQKIIAEETARETATKKLVAEYKRKFIELTHLEIRFEQMNVSYDPRNIMPVEDKGTVYPNIRVSDKWGILTVTNGALMSPAWDKISISIPTKNDDQQILGDGWRLELKEGYAIIKENEDNIYKLVKK